MISRNHFFALLGGAALSLSGLGATMAQENKENTVVVAHLGTRITKQEVEDLFWRYGFEVVGVYLMQTPQGTPRGIALVEMATRDEAKAAVQKLNFTQYQLRQISVGLVVQND